MSDETPDAHIDTAEPSMEDILASIRRIIADEDGAEAANIGLEPDNAATESFSIVEATLEDDAVDLIPDTLLDAQLPKADNVVEALDLTELDVTDDSLADLDLNDLSAEPDVEPQIEVDDADIDLLLTELESEIEAENFAPALAENDVAADKAVDDSVRLKGLGAVAAAAIGAVAAAGGVAAESLSSSRRNPTPEKSNDEKSEALDLMFESETESVDSEIHALLEIPSAEDPQKDDIDALLGDMLFDEDETVVTDETIIDPAQNLIEPHGDELSDELLSDLLGDTDKADVEMPSATQAPEDLDLVKSLMADLTDDPYDGATDLHETDTAETDIVDEILDLSMEDEIAHDTAENDPDIDAFLGSDDEEGDSASVAAEDAFVIDIREDLSETLAAPASSSSALAAIAASAEEDAKRAENRTKFAATGFAAGAGMMIASAGPAAATVNADGETEQVASNLQEAEDILAAIDPSNAEAETVAGAAEAHIQTQSETAETAQDINPTEETAAMPKAAAKKEAIVDNVTEEVAAGAFASLNQVVEEKAVMADRGDRIGDLVQEALRPMLKEWLDKNLKGIVERAVTKEVKRISTGK